ncbi:MAG TPA: hypothetical protein PKY05_16230, partial [Fibrobacteria bacterium]|nr:hypothetical protein [Fibrobacteria bacterium]
MDGHLDDGVWVRKLQFDAEALADNRAPSIPAFSCLDISCHSTHFSTHSRRNPKYRTDPMRGTGSVPDANPDEAPP